MADSPADILTQPGRLIWAPTDLSIANPYGGTALGFSEEGVRLRLDASTIIVTSEELGPEPVRVIWGGAAPKIFVEFLQWDANTVQRMFPGGLSAAGTTARIVTLPGTLVPGQAIPTAALLFVPDDTTNGKAVLFHKVAPAIPETAELQFRLRSRTTLPLVFHAMREDGVVSSDAEYNYRLMAIGTLSDLSIEVV